MRQLKYEVYCNINDYFHDRFQVHYGDPFWRACKMVEHIWGEQAVFRLFRDTVEALNRR